MSDLVSIIVATYNRKVALGRCLKSLLAQTYQPIEIIVVDDGSTDGTKALFSGESAETRVNYIRLSVNQGATAARNKGLDVARGRYTLVWDSDDLLYSEAVEKLVKVFAEQPRAVVVSAPARVLREGKEVAFERIPTGAISYRTILCRAMPTFKLVRLVKKDVAGDVRYVARGLDFMVNTRLATRGLWYHLDVFLGEHFLAQQDKNSLTNERRKPNIKNSTERSKPLSEYLSTFGADMKKCCPRLYADYSYGAAIGFLLRGDQKMSYRLAAQAVRFHPLDFRHVALFNIVHLPWAGQLMRWLFKRGLVDVAYQYAIFICIGGLGSILTLVLTLLLTELANIWYLDSYIIATLIGWTVGFLLNSRFTFYKRLSSALFKRYFLYIVLYAVLGLVNFSLVFVITSLLGFYYVYSVILVTALMSVLTFITNKKYIFP